MAMKNLYDSGLRRAQVHRVGDITEIVFDGAGAVVATTLDFKTVQRWAMSRLPSGNEVRDRGTIIARLETCVVRRGTSIAGTQGSNKPLLKLVQAMQKAGLNLSEWSVPPAVQAELAGDDPNDDKDEEAVQVEQPGDDAAAYTPPEPNPQRQRTLARKRRERKAMDALLKRLK